MITFGQQLKAFRETAVMTQREFARFLEVPYDSLRSYEYNRRRPQSPVLYRMIMRIEMNHLQERDFVFMWVHRNKATPDFGKKGWSTASLREVQLIT